MAQKSVKRKSATRTRTVNQMGLADKMKLVEKSTERKTSLPEFHTGDTISVMVRIKEGEKERLQAFEGVVIAIGNHGATKSFTVRKISHGVGVERVFQMNSPKIGKIEVRQSGKTRRSKLYYLRELEGKAAKLDRDLHFQTNDQMEKMETADKAAPKSSSAKKS